MTPARTSLLLLLAVASCETQRKPIRGFDKQPPGSIVIDGQAVGAGALMLWPIFDLPPEPQQIFQPRLDGKDAVLLISPKDGFYDYATLTLQGWTGGWSNWFQGVSPGTYVVELVDGAGQSWGQSAPLTIPAGSAFSGGQLPGVMFANFDDKVASWNIEPATQDSDPTTDEITVTNLVDEDVVVQRCLIASGTRASCVAVGTVAPGADLHTVETIEGLPKGDHQALVIHLTSAPTQTYQRDLDEGSGPGGPAPFCQMERIIVHGNNRSPDRSTPTGPAGMALSSCYGYQSGPP